MATNTTKLGLIKPDFVDVVDITDLNTNADDIDAAVGFTICTNATRPSTPWTGQSIFETDTESSFIWDGSTWKPGGGGGSIEISATAPSSPAQGDLWWDSDNGNLYIYYDDGDSQQWVAANGPQVFVGTTAPPGYQGQMWFDSSTGKMYVYYDDGSSAQWVSAIGGSIAGTIKQVVSITKTDVFSASVAVGANTPVTGLSVSITPSSTSSKIYVSGFTSLITSALDQHSHIFLMKDGSALSGATATSAGSRQAATAGGHHAGGADRYTQSIPFQFLDSPATISPVTYSINAGHTSSSTTTILVNRGPGDTDNSANARYVSTITVMEVAG